eukprot:g82298.t1
MAKDPYVLSAKPDPARVAAFLVGRKSSGLKTALRNEFDKIDRARITLVQVTDQLVKLREKNIIGKGEPGQADICAKRWVDVAKAENAREH